MQPIIIWQNRINLDFGDDQQTRALMGNSNQQTLTRNSNQQTQNNIKKIIISKYVYLWRKIQTEDMQISAFS